MTKLKEVFACHGFAVHTNELRLCTVVIDNVLERQQHISINAVFLISQFSG